MAAPDVAARGRGGLLSRTFESFHHREFRLFYLGQLVNVTGTWMQTVAVGWLVLTLTGSPWLLGAATIARTVPVLLFSFVGGMAADRFERRRVLLVANVAGGVLSAVFAALTAAGRIDVAGVLVLAFLIGLSQAFEMPTRQAWIVELTGPRHLANAIALNSMLFNGARVLGPALAGIIVAAFGPAAAFGLNAVSYIPVLGVLLVIHPAPSEERPASGRARGALAEAVGYLRRESAVALLLGLLAANTTFASGYLVLAPALAHDLGQGADGLGLLLAATGLGAVAAGFALAASAGRVAGARTLILAGFALAGFVAAVGLSRSFPVTLLLMTGLGVAMVSYTATSNTLIQSIVPGALRGRVMSLYTIVMVGMMPANGLFAGGVAERWGTPAAFLTGATIWAACVALGFGFSRRLRAV